MDTFCRSTIPGGNVTETERERERERERDANKEFRALGGTTSQRIICWNQSVRQTDRQTEIETRGACAWPLGGSVSLCFDPFNSNCFEVSLRFAAFDSNCFEGCSCKN